MLFSRSPAFIEPMTAVTVMALPEGDQWLYEVKLDRYRALLLKHGGHVQIRSRGESYGRLGRHAIVAVMEPAHLRGHDDLVGRCRCSLGCCSRRDSTASNGAQPASYRPPHCIQRTATPGLIAKPLLPSVCNSKACTRSAGTTAKFDPSLMGTSTPTVGDATLSMLVR